MSTRVTGVLFAEEFRPELSGQVNVIGMFPPRAALESFPWKERVAVMLILEGEGQHKMRLILDTESGAEFASAEFPVGGLEPNLPAYLHLPPRRITLSSPDIVQVRVGFDGAEPTVVGRLVIAAAEDYELDHNDWSDAAIATQD